MRDLNKPVWGLLDVLLATLGFIFAMSVFVTLAVGIARQAPSLRHAKLDAVLNDVRVAVPAQVAAYIAMVGLMVLLVTIKGRGPFSQEISWNPPPRKRAWTAMVIGIGLVGVAVLAEHYLARWLPKSVPISNYFRDTTSAYMLAAFGIFVAPPVEELYFRGFLYPAVARWTGVGPAVVLTSAAFAALHGSQLAFAWVPMLVVFVVGLALNIIRIKTASVATGMITHMTYNFVLMLGTFIGTHGFRKFDNL